MPTRPPVVVILGHVDHGKTSLLDALSKTHLTATEAGGITQSTRAFQVDVPGAGLITFIDTPGHQAFSQMRSRGGKLADMALLVVAGNDGVMPQTKESIAIIQSLNMPYIVVVTKADLAEFNLDKVKTQLAEVGVLVEGFGGDIPLVTVSAKNNQGLAELLEVIHLLSQLHPPGGDETSPVEAVVLESQRDAKRGPVAVVVVKGGILTEGQLLFVGQKEMGKVKALTNTQGIRVKTALPATPVEILGLTANPPAGAVISTAPQAATTSTPDFVPNTAGFRVILKADVAGSVEAILQSLPADIAIITSGTGEVLESDVMHAQSTGAVIVGFNVKVPSSVAKLAEIDKVKIYTANIIYELLDQIEKWAHPQPTEMVTGQAQILAEFNMDGGHIAGAKCISGEIKKGDIVRINQKEARIKSLRTAKTEIEAVKENQEFGAIFSPPIDFKVGDIIIAIVKHGQN